MSKNTLEEDPEMYESALNEMGTSWQILSENIYDLLGTRVFQSTPEILIGDAKELFAEITDRIGNGSTSVLNIETMFRHRFYPILKVVLLLWRHVSFS